MAVDQLFGLSYFKRFEQQEGGNFTRPPSASLISRQKHLDVAPPSFLTLQPRRGRTHTWGAFSRVNRVESLFALNSRATARAC